MKREEIKNFLKEVLSGLEDHDELSVIRNKVVFAAMEFGSMLAKDVHPDSQVVQEVILPAIKRFEERVNKAFNI